MKAIKGYYNPNELQDAEIYILVELADGYLYVPFAVGVARGEADLIDEVLISMDSINTSDFKWFTMRPCDVSLEGYVEVLPEGV